MEEREGKRKGRKEKTCTHLEFHPGWSRVAETLFLGQRHVPLLHGGSAVKHDLPGEHREHPPGTLRSSHTCTTSSTSAMSLCICAKVTEWIFCGES